MSARAGAGWGARGAGCTAQLGGTRAQPGVLGELTLRSAGCLFLWPFNLWSLLLRAQGLLPFDFSWQSPPSPQSLDCDLSSDLTPKKPGKSKPLTLVESFLTF